jgi:hypothetical protein
MNDYFEKGFEKTALVGAIAHGAGKLIGGAKKALAL